MVYSLEQKWNNSRLGDYPQLDSKGVAGTLLSMDTGILLGVIGIVLALVGIALAVSPFIQMVCGTARLVVTYKQGQDYLSCRISNEPISSRFLHRLRVVRVETQISVQYMILKASDRSIIFGPAYPKFLDSGDFKYKLASSEYCDFVLVGHSEGRAYVTGRAKQTPSIEPGKYVVRIDVKDMNRNDAQSHERAFTIGANFVETRWDEPVQCVA